MVLSKLHSLPIVDRLIFHKTYEWIKRLYFWDDMNKEIHSFVDECDIFQHHKGETMKTPSAL